MRCIFRQGIPLKSASGPDSPWLKSRCMSHGWLDVVCGGTTGSSERLTVPTPRRCIWYHSVFCETSNHYAYCCHVCVCVCVRVSCSSPVSRYLSVCIVWSTRRSVCLALTHRAERCLLTFSRHCSTTGSLISMSVYTALALPAVCLSVCLSVSLSVCYSVTHHSISAQSSVLTSKPL